MCVLRAAVQSAVPTSLVMHSLISQQCDIASQQCCSTLAADTILIFTTMRRVRLERVNSRGEYGYMVFVSHHDTDVWQEGAAKGLVVHISGDTLYCLTTLLRNEPCSRPFPLDILSNVINSRSEQAMDVVKVAIVSLKGDTFMGRIYFGAHRTRRYSKLFRCRSYSLVIDASRQQRTLLCRRMHDLSHPLQCGCGLC